MTERDREEKEGRGALKEMMACVRNLFFSVLQTLLKHFTLNAEDITNILQKGKISIHKSNKPVDRSFASVLYP